MDECMKLQLYRSQTVKDCILQLNIRWAFMVQLCSDWVWSYDIMQGSVWVGLCVAQEVLSVGLSLMSGQMKTILVINSVLV